MVDPKSYDEFLFLMPQPTPEGTERLRKIMEERRGQPVSDAVAEEALRRVITLVWHLHGLDQGSLREMSVGGTDQAGETHLPHEPNNASSKTLAERRAQRIQKLSKTMAVKRAAGQVTGRLPLGYTVIQVNGVSVAVEDPDTMKLLAEAKEMQVRGVPLRAIRRYLTEKGFRGRNGKPISVTGLWETLNKV
ncbi:MAG: hypothetical protein JSS66_08495 [Armatimonadetes bacterium]|nr:hypothetical protein [Armatimonadota bacterium]